MGNSTGKRPRPTGKVDGVWQPANTRIVKRTDKDRQLDHVGDTWLPEQYRYLPPLSARTSLRDFSLCGGSAVLLYNMSPSSLQSLATPTPTSLYADSRLAARSAVPTSTRAFASRAIRHTECVAYTAAHHAAFDTFAVSLFPPTLYCDFECLRMALLTTARANVEPTPPILRSHL